MTSEKQIRIFIGIKLDLSEYQRKINHYGLKVHSFERPE